MRDDKYISSRNDIRNKRNRNKRRQVMMNRVIFLGILLIVTLLLIIVGIRSCRENEDTPKIIDNNDNVEDNSDEEKESTPEGESEESESKEDESTSDTLLTKAYLTDGKRIICIDPGHGGIDGGSGDANTFYEKDDNIKMAKALKGELEKLGITVFLTRENDEFLNLETRTKKANSVNPDLIISLHRNEYTSDPSVRGFEAWVHSSKPKDSTSAATKIQEALVKAGISRDRGVKYGAQSSPTDDYYVNNHSIGPSCLLEMGFMTNVEDNNTFRNKTQEIAKAMAKAIEEWLDAQGL